MGDKIRKRLEAEKMELEAALSEAEGALEQEENKVLRCQLELTQVKQEVEQRIHQKEEEFASTKKNFAKALEGMQMALETETKGKVEALRMKKKLEADVLIWELLLNTPTLPMQRVKRTSSLFNKDSEMSKPSLKKKIELRPLLRITSLLLIAGAMQTKMHLKNPALSLNRLTGTGV